jgi:ATP-dependent protease HslVU (ClpYQ) peptidase subunit
MTVIIGILDKKNRKTYVGGDGVTVAGTYIVTTDKDKIVQLNSNCIIAGSGYSLKSSIISAFPDKVLEGLPATYDETVAFKLRTNLISVLEEHGLVSKVGEDSNLSKWEGCFTVAFCDQLFNLSSSLHITDYANEESDENYGFVFNGCAELEAEVYMRALYEFFPDMDPIEMITRTIENCKHYDININPSTLTTIKVVEW